jgi:hypothetical protein
VPCNDARMEGTSRAIFDHADDVLRKLRMIPDHARDFDVSDAAAMAVLRLPADLLAHVNAAGLARTSHDGRLLFDFDDLTNLSLELGIRSPWTAGMRFWRRALEAGGPYRECRVSYVFSCLDSRHTGPCQVEVLTPDRGWVRQDVTGQAAPARLAAVSEFRLRNDWPELPPDITELVEEVGQLEYKRLPADLGLQRDFVDRTGLVDCAGAARILVDEARRRGLPARPAAGLIAVPPYSSVHYWMEFLVDDIWTPTDPVMVKALIRWGLLSRERWHVGRSIGGILGRLSDVTPLARHSGAAFSISMPTEDARP